MKKKILTILLALVTAVCVTGCADNNSGGGLEPVDPTPVDPSPVTPVDPTPVDPTPVEPDTPDEPEEPVDETDPYEDKFTVSLYYGGEKFYPDYTVQAQWTKLNTFGEVVGIPVTAKFNDDGVAVADDLDGNYKVSLIGVPANYTYNPNIEEYFASADSKHVKIELVKLNTTKNGGTEYYTDRINIENIQEGPNVYKVTVKNASQHIFFTFTPSKNGVYTLESWVDITANEVNPYLYLYNGSSVFINLADPKAIVDGGGLSASYTKNFKYEILIEEQTVRGATPFSVMATTSKTYPVDVYFSLKYESPYTPEDNYEYVIPEEFLPVYSDADYQTKLAEVNATGDGDAIKEFLATYKPFSSASNEVSDKKLTAQSIMYKFGNTKHYFPIEGYMLTENYYQTDESGKKVLYKAVRLNPDDGYYHFYYPLTGTWGEVICASFAEDTICLVTDHRYGTGLNNTKLPRRLNGKDYTNLLSNYYNVYAVNGFYPVTVELKEYLQALIKSQALFFDGNGWLETGSPAYSSTEDAQWLACCVFFN